MKKAPEYIAAKARARVEASAERRNKVLKAIYAGRPLDAEPDEARTIHRLQRVAGVDADQAASLADYQEDVLSRLKGDKRLGAERIQGKTEDFVGVAFLELARIAASTVGRVISEDKQPIGSGFMISDRLFLTNNHVIPDIFEARQYLAEFNYEMSIDRQPKPVTRFKFKPDEFFLTNPEDELDFTVVAIGQTVYGEGRLSDFGYCPLIGSDDKHVLGEFVNIIQHPEGDYKQVVLRENQLVTRLDRLLHYLADTNPGSSGSPVFNDQWEVIALHHWGEPTELITPDGKPVRKDVNEGVRISKILSDLTSKRNSIKEPQCVLLDAALNPQFRQPSIVHEHLAGRRLEEIVSSQGKSSDSISQEVKPDGTVTWKIPLEISVRLGGISQPQPPLASIQREPIVVSEKDQDFTRPSLEEAIRIDPDYSNRPGYDSHFLLRHDVPLPKLSDAQKHDAARLKRVNRGEDPYELKYQHFSIVINADRRMAFFTAVNVD